MEMLNVLNLFENVKIDNTTKISGEDLEFMNDLQNKLDKTKEGFKKYIEFFRNNIIKSAEDKEITRSIYTIEDDFIKDVVFKELDRYISKFYYYFIDKYSVKLNVMEHSKDYYKAGRVVEANNNLKWYLEELNLNMLLDDISNQLGGFKFEDKAEEEIKERLKKNCCKWRNEETVIVKNNKVSIKNYLWFDQWDIKWHNTYKNRREAETKDLFKVLALHETGDLNSNIFDSTLEYLTSWHNDVIGEYELNGSKVASIKVFKNGKLDIKFTSGLEALTFARKYLGYAK